MKREKSTHTVIPIAKVFLVIGLIVLIIAMGIAFYMVKNAAYQAGYNRGFSDGYSKGEEANYPDTSYSIGYDMGYSDALTAYGLNPDNLAGSTEESWPYQMLTADWIEVGELAYETPRELYVTEESIHMTTEDGNVAYNYILPEAAYTQVRPDGEVYLELDNCKEFVNFIIHEEQIDGVTIPILSATIAELDGRGEIIIAEFAKMDEAHIVPASFRSSSRIMRDEQDAPPMKK